MASIGGEQAGGIRQHIMKWTTNMDKAFMEQLLKHGANLKSDNGLAKETWISISNTLSKELGFRIDVKHLKNHVKYWKRSYFEIKELRSQPGFGWDDSKKLVEASDPTWAEYLQGHHDMARWRKQSLPNYDELALIMGEGCATEGQTFTEKKLIPYELDDMEHLDTIGTEVDMSVDETDIPPIDTQTLPNTSSQGARSRASTSSNKKESKKRKKNTGDKLADAFGLMAHTLAQIAETDKKRVENDERRMENEARRMENEVRRMENDARRVTTEERKAIEIKTMKEAINKLPGVGLVDRYRAMSQLATNEDLCRLFLELEEEHRLGWFISQFSDEARRMENDARRMVTTEERKAAEIRAMKEAINKLPGVGLVDRYKAMSQLATNEDLRRLFLELEEEHRLGWFISQFPSP